MRVIAAHGAWDSPLSAAQVSAGAIRLTLIDLDGDRVVWTELRPAEAGRTCMLEARLDGLERRELSPPGLDVRALVHEYGGGAARAQLGVRLAVSFADQRLWRLPGPGACDAAAEPILVGSPRAGSARFADFDLSPDGRWVAMVCERASSDPPQTEPENLLLAVPLDGGRAVVLAEGHDFFASPRFSRDGKSIAYLSWDHPALPWDGTTLWCASWEGERPGPAQRVAGGPAESILQPAWSPSGRLTFVSDRTGFWNLYQVRPSGEQALAPLPMEFARPAWALGQSTYGFVEGRRLVACATSDGLDRLLLIDEENGGVIREISLGLVSVESVRAQGASVAVLGSSTDRGERLITLELQSGRIVEIARAEAQTVDSDDVALPEPVAFASQDGQTSHAFFYPPQSRRFEGPPGERPPLLVQCHGGPTSSATAAFRPLVQFWTSRGFAVVDVNYGGSSGFGRRYRQRLNGAWGVVDVADCCAAARYLIESGRVDGRRLVIRGGSAGGYTALCAVAADPSFAAAASYYGVADLVSFASETHKFESRYLETLIGPLPQAADLYRRRSPLNLMDRIRTPLIVMQGLQDRVVTPSQSERLIAALDSRRVTHAYLPFADESHGFRRAANIERALRAELTFYGRVLGFSVREPVEIPIRHLRP